MRPTTAMVGVAMISLVAPAQALLPAPVPGSQKPVVEVQYRPNFQNN